MNPPTGKVSSSSVSHSAQLGQTSSPKNVTVTWRNGPKQVKTRTNVKPTVGLISPNTQKRRPEGKGIGARSAVIQPAKPRINATMKKVESNERVTIKPIEHSVHDYLNARAKMAIAAIRTIVSVIQGSTNGSEKLTKMGITQNILDHLEKIKQNEHNDRDIEVVAEALGNNQKNIIEISKEIVSTSNIRLNASVSNLFTTPIGTSESTFESLIKDCANIYALKSTERTNNKLGKEIILLKAQLSQQKNEMETKATKNELTNAMESWQSASESSSIGDIENLKIQIQKLNEELEELRNTRQENSGATENSTTADAAYSSVDIEKKINTKLEILKKELEQKFEQVKDNQKLSLENKASTTSKLKKDSAEVKVLREKLDQFEQQLNDTKEALNTVLKKSEADKKKVASAEKSIAEVAKKLQRIQDDSKKSAKELIERQAQLHAHSTTIESYKNKQDEITQDTQEALINLEESKQVQSISQGTPQETTRTTTSQPTRQEELTKLQTLLQEKLHAAEEKIFTLDRDNQALQQQHSQLQTATQKVKSLPDQGEPFKNKEKQTDKLTKVSDGMKDKQANHVESVDKVTAQVNALSKETGETQRTVHSLASIPKMNAGQSIRYEPTTKNQDKYGDKWGEAVNLVKKQASLQLLSDAKRVLTALQARDFGKFPTEPVISIRINGELQELSKSNPAFIELIKDENIDEYKKIINQTNSALTLKKKELKKEYTRMTKRKSKDIILYIDTTLDTLKSKLDRNNKNKSSWNDDIKALKTHFEQTLILESDDYCVVRKKEKDKQSDDSI